MQVRTAQSEDEDREITGNYVAAGRCASAGEGDATEHLLDTAGIVAQLERELAALFQLSSSASAATMINQGERALVPFVKLERDSTED